ncbi:hypothetical protein GCM10008937_28710 [Deinococcus depolymerans]|uniref:Uncharacterized protein n=1 Tax=Deinococcus depolymerans TaxID=392408 RepID=A0ABN1CHR3_9DEIO
MVISWHSTQSVAHSISCPGTTASCPLCAARIFSAIVIPIQSLPKKRAPGRSKSLPGANTERWAALNAPNEEEAPPGTPQPAKNR